MTNYRGRIDAVNDQIEGAVGYRIKTRDLRHTFATEIYERTGDIRVVQRLLGHTNIQTTIRYLTSSGKREREAVAAMDSVLIGALASAGVDMDGVRQFTPAQRAEHEAKRTQVLQAVGQQGSVPMTQLVEARPDLNVRHLVKCAEREGLVIATKAGAVKVLQLTPEGQTQIERLQRKATTPDAARSRAAEVAATLGKCKGWLARAVRNKSYILRGLRW